MKNIEKRCLLINIVTLTDLMLLRKIFCLLYTFFDKLAHYSSHSITYDTKFFFINNFVVKFLCYWVIIKSQHKRLKALFNSTRFTNNKLHLWEKSLIYYTLTLFLSFHTNTLQIFLCLLSFQEHLKIASSSQLTTLCAFDT